MQLLFIDYTNLVIKAYEEKRDADQLSRLLLQPTTAGIRQACLNTYNARVRNGEDIEENTLTDFFGVPPAGKKIAYHIENYSADRFRPIQKLMRREIKNPALTNVELLAWLIDFTPRPLAQAQKILEGAIEPIIPILPIVPPINVSKQNPEQVPQEGIKELPLVANPANPKSIPKDGEGNGTNTGKENTDSRPSNNPKKSTGNRKLKRVVSAGLIAAALFGGGYGIWQHGKAGDIAYGNTSADCMYWSGDHYESIACNQKRKGTIILPFDEEKMKNFRKITRDTMTEWSIGKAYYIKDNNIIEYYTTAGTHPIHVADSLKVLSRYMFDKYLRKKDVARKDSLP